ncbi:hypothetical protein SteCoe_17417 [Stentor coeruleus]|uniref:Ion transport domain-containing protein n=1 Tax=Stentor coeruleus TaxID=5963 RepID=A0A1R2BZ20_9CILI|nr:hypothetical protein SteCoe_17417 [Stentor coeruleus]
MSGLSEPLIKADSALKISESMKNLAISQRLECNNTQGVIDAKSVKKGFEDIKAAINNSFKYKAIEFPYECELIKVSPKHSLLVGSSTKNSELVVIDLKTMVESKRVKTNLNSLCSIKINKNEDQIFLGSDEGKLARYDFPSFSQESYKEVEIGSENAIFDEFEGIIYAYDSDKGNLITYNFETEVKETIARCAYVEFIRVNSDATQVAVSAFNGITVFSRPLKWKKFVYKIEKDDDYYYEEDENGEEVWVDKKSEIEFSNDGEKLAISIENKIYVWNLEIGKLLVTYELHTSKDISSIKFSKDDEYLIAVGKDHSINIWDLESSNPLPIFLNQPLKDLDKDGKFDFSSRFYDMEIDEDRNLIYTHGLDSKFSYQWKGIFLDKIRFPQSDFGKNSQRCITCKRTNQAIVTSNETSEIYIWDIETLDMSRVVKIPEGSLWEISFGEEEEKTLLVGSDNKIYIYDFDTMNDPKTIKNEKAGSIHAIRSNSNYIISGGSNAIVVIQDKIGGFIHEIPGYNEMVTGMKVTLVYLITGDAAGKIFIHYMNTWELYTVLDAHTSWIRTIEMFKDNDTLITVALDKKCIFWSIYDKTAIKTTELTGKIETCYLSKDERNFILSTTTGEVYIYNLPSFDLIDCLNYDSKDSQRFAFDADEKYLIVSNDEGVFKTLSPISPDNPTIIDKNINIPEVRMFLEGERIKGASIKDQWIIAPYMVNSLHYYSSENLKKDLKKAMIMGSKYLKSSIGNPLNISLAKGNTEATGTIINQLKGRISSNLYALETVSDCLIELNKGGFKGLDDLYSDCLIPVPATEKLPDCCPEGLSLPIVNYSLTMKVNSDLLIGPPSEDSTKRITFLVSALRLNLEIGSKESIDFLKSLLICSNTEIFKTKFIQYILNDKWSKVRRVMLLNGLLFILYLICLSFFIIMREPLLLIIALVMNILMFTYELIQININASGYFTEFWNYIDLSRAALFYVYFFYTYDNPSDNYKWLLVAVTILSWVRGITLFGLSSNTRYMISLLTEVIKDIIAFAIVVFYSIISFAFIKMAFKDLNKDDHYFIIIGDLIIESFFEATGGGDSNTEGFTMVLVIFNSIFNVIIMMNLLISILGTTYGRVNDDAQVEDLKQLTEMIIEAESFYFYRRNEKKKTIMQICEEYTPAEVVGVDDLRNRFRTVKNEIIILKQKMEENQKANLRETRELAQDAIETRTKIETSKKEIITELKTVIKDLGKQILAVTQTQETEEKHQDPFVCLYGHSLKPKHIYDCVCDICSDELDDADSVYCNICDFGMCMKCANLYLEHSQKKAGINCKDGHILLQFDNITEFFNEQNYESNQICRFCSDTVGNEGYHCVPCMFNLCVKCKDNYALATKSKDTKIVCGKGHNLKWKHKELYEKEFLIIFCTECGGERAGSGFFCCIECQSRWCLNCVSKQITGHSEDGGNENRNIDDSSEEEDEEDEEEEGKKEKSENKAKKEGEGEGEAEVKGEDEEEEDENENEDENEDEVEDEDDD